MSDWEWNIVHKINNRQIALQINFDFMWGLLVQDPIYFYDYKN